MCTRHCLHMERHEDFLKGCILHLILKGHEIPALMQVTFLFEFKAHENIAYRCPHLTKKTTIVLVTGQMYFLFPVIEFVMGKKPKPPQNLKKNTFSAGSVIMEMHRYTQQRKYQRGKKSTIYLFQCSGTLSLEKSLRSCLVFV